MNKTLEPYVVPVVPWVTSDHLVRAPDSLLALGFAKNRPTTLVSSNCVVPTLYDVVEDFDADVTQRAKHMEERVSATEAVLPNTVPQMAIQRKAWTDAIFDTVKRHPLLSAVSAMAMGALIWRRRL